MTESQQLLVDTDVLIEYLRGSEQAIVFLESLERRPAISVICVAEVLAGVRDETEQEAIECFLQTFDILPVDDAAARLGGHYRRTYAKSHGTSLADALVAATAVNNNLRLATFNARHYPTPTALTPYPRDTQ
ncbi:MAG: type II toxin-antitoxin system VapC family toxin [Anaerolineae bacterium]|nr:type II toxin-antitoxin system VapC family toxin [Anaerolineae bacterium]